MRKPPVKNAPLPTADKNSLVPQALADKAFMDKDNVERRQSGRIPCTGVVTVQMADGDYKGASLVGLVTDISDRGLCLVLDGGWFARKVAVTIEFSDGLALTGWVAHCKEIREGARVGIAFGPCPSDTLQSCAAPVRDAESPLSEKLKGYV